MGIDAVGGTGHQGAQVLSGDADQVLGLRRKNNLYLVYFVGYYFLKDIYRKGIPYFQITEIRKEFGTGVAGVACQNGMIPLSSNGKRRFRHMAHTFGQDFFGGSVIDGQVHIYLWDTDIAHHAAGDVQDLLIALGFYTR